MVVVRVCRGRSQCSPLPRPKKALGRRDDEAARPLLTPPHLRSPCHSLGVLSRGGSVTSISSHPTQISASHTAVTTRKGITVEKPQKIGFLYVAPLTPDVDGEESESDAFVAPCATLDLAAVGNDADCLGGVLEKTKKMIELVVRPLTDKGFRALGEAGAHILHLNIHGNHKGLAAEDGCGALTPLHVQSFRSVITSGGFVNIEIIIICSPNQPATNIGQEFHELGVTVGAGSGGEPGTTGRAAFHVICIETERLSQVNAVPALPSSPPRRAAP